MVMLTLPFASLAASGQNGPETEVLRLLSPDPHQVVIHKKPVIEVTFQHPVQLKTLFIMMDGIDVTQLAAVTAQGFTYTPIQVLAPGTHTLMVSGQTAKGRQFDQEFSFTTRHHEAIELVYSENEITVVGKSAVATSESMEDETPEVRIDANWRTTSKLQEKGFDLSLTADARWLDQDIDPVSPEVEGVNWIDFLVSANYTKGNLTTHAEMGDTNIVLSNNTLSSLSRRGGQFSMGTETVSVGTFSVNSAQTYHFDGELGIGSDPQKHINGWYGDLALLDKRLHFRVVHASGGESGSSFGTSTDEADKEGDVTGAVLSTDFFDGKFMTEFEYDRAEYDEDTTDSLAAEEDSAYRLQLQGGVNRYTYSAAYRYTGPHYGVVGNEGLEQDRAGVSLDVGANYDRHSVSLTYSSVQDNVEEDDSKAVTVTDTSGLDYTYMGLENVSINVNYQKEVAQSRDEPALTDPTHQHTDTLFAAVTRTHNQWNLGLQSTYVTINDLTDLDADSNNITVSLLPQYYSEAISVSPNLTYSRTDDQSSDIITDTYTLGLDVQGRFYNDKFCYSVGGTFDVTTTDDDSVDQHTTVYYLNLDYKIGDRIWGYVSPKISLQGESSEVDDKVSEELTRDYTFKLVFSSSVLFSF